jgi:acyl-CoA reductase-like NAD-dependent aldehyde dehydrogenase
MQEMKQWLLLLSTRQRGETLKTFEAMSSEAIEAKLELAQQAFNKYRHLPFEQRAVWMQKRQTSWSAIAKFTLK